MEYEGGIVNKTWTFGKASLIFAALTWGAAIFGEFYPWFGNRSAPYCVALAIVCHVFAILAHFFKSGRTIAIWTLISFWLICFVLFIYQYTQMTNSMNQLLQD